MAPMMISAVVRYNADGSLDTGFGASGIVMTDFANSFDEAYSVTVQSDGKILVAGQGSTVSFTGFGMVRYNADGDRGYQLRHG